MEQMADQVMKTYQPTGTAGTRKLVMAALLAVTISASAVAFAAEAYLERVDFESAHGATEITLRADREVNYKKVHVSDNKLILDIEGIDAERAIRTNFSGAFNVSHVIIQPRSADRIRLIVRGEDLGMPRVRYKSPTHMDIIAEANALSNEIDAAIDDILTETPEATPEEELSINGDTVANETDTPLNDAIESDLNANLSEDVAETGRLLSESPKKARAVEGEALPLPALSGKNSEPIQDEPIQETSLIDDGLGVLGMLQSKTADANLPKILKWGILGLMALGLGLFGKRKYNQIRLEKAQFSELMAQQQAGQDISFRDMARAYKNQGGHEQPAIRNRQQQPAHGHPAGNSSLIGLNGLKAVSQLNQQLNQDVTRFAAAADQGLPKQGYAARPKSPAPSKLAVNQYRKNNLSPKRPAAKAPAKAPAQQAKNPLLNRQQAQQPQQAGRKRQVSNDVLRQEMARAKDVSKGLQVNQTRQALNNKRRQAPAQPGLQQQPRREQATGNRNNPLPDNPEVLNFLKNVADLVEKDGRSDLAQSINKGLR